MDAARLGALWLGCFTLKLCCNESDPDQEWIRKPLTSLLFVVTATYFKMGHGGAAPLLHI